MTKAIEDELGLPRLEDALKELGESSEEMSTVPEEVNDQVEQMANALQHVSPSKLPSRDLHGVDEHEAEANDIYEQAMRAHKDLLDLGFNIEPKNAGANAFMPSAKMLEIALKASQSKAVKKMERIRMIMEKERHDHELRNNQEEGVIDGDTSAGGSIIANRNDLMEKIRKGEI